MSRPKGSPVPSVPVPARFSAIETRDAAWHALVGLGPDALPQVVQPARSERDPRVVADLVRVVGEYRTVAALPFLASLLDSAAPRVWKAALDALVTLGCLRGLAASDDAEKRSWIDEAIEQAETTRGIGDTGNRATF